MRPSASPASSTANKKKTDVNAQQPDGTTALHWAVYQNDAKTTAELLRAGARVTVPNNYGVTPLAIAAKNGNAVIIEQLLKAGAGANDPVNFVNAAETPLMHAARSGNVEAVKALLHGKADLNAKETWNGQNALMWAAAEGNGAAVERSSKRAPISRRNRTPARRR